MKKKIVAFLLVGCICLQLVACGGRGVMLDSDTKDLTKELKSNVVYSFDDSVIAGDDYDETTVNTALADFAVRLFQENVDAEMTDGSGTVNIMISPISVITALGMTSFGAKGDTLIQMEETFGVRRGELNYYNSAYLRNISDELKMANSIWFTNDGRVAVRDEFLQFNEEFYNADIYTTSFDRATVKSINNWVKDKTDGTIQEVLDEIPADAVMYLINALTFESEWKNEYMNTDIRKNAEFTNYIGEIQKVDMMCSEESLYLQDENATGFVKYYEDQNYAFVALLPNEGIDVYGYINGLTGEHLQEMLTNPIQTKVDARLPQFSFEYDVEMSKLLEKMGMPDAFDGSQADFTGMATSTQGNIFINRVLHKTFIEVTPVGTKAGAATVVEMNLDCAPHFEKQVYLDRPFIYMIIDCENNLPVFIGVVSSVE